MVIFFRFARIFHNYWKSTPLKTPIPQKSKINFLQIAQPEIYLNAGSLFSGGLFVKLHVEILFFQVSQEFFTIIGRGRH